MRRFMILKSNQQGFTLLEFLFAFGAISAIAIAIAGITQVAVSSSKKLDTSLTTLGIRNLLLTNVENITAWRHTLSQNEEMACIIHNTSCDIPASQPFKLYNEKNVLVYDGTSPTEGFTTDGIVCHDYPNPNTNCILRYDLTWKPVCPTAACTNPPILVSAAFNGTQTASAGVPAMGDLIYSFQIFKGFAKNAVETNCQALNGVMDANDRSCAVLITQKRCPAGLMVSGIQATGDLICQSPFSGLCGFNQVVSGFQPNGRVVCVDKGIQLAVTVPSASGPSVTTQPSPGPGPSPSPAPSTLPIPLTSPHYTVVPLPNGGTRLDLKSKDPVATVAYEDKLTNSDHDFNDFVSSTNISEVYNSLNELVEINIQYSPIWDTGAYPSRFVLTFDGNVRGRYGFTSNLASFTSRPMFEGDATIEYELFNGSGIRILKNSAVPKDEDLIVFPNSTHAVANRMRATITIKIADPSLNTMASRGGLSIVRYRSVLAVRECVGLQYYDIDLSDINPTMFDSSNLPLAFFVPADWQPPAVATTIFESYPDFQSHANYMHTNNMANEPALIRSWYNKLIDANKVLTVKGTSLADKCAL